MKKQTIETLKETIRLMDEIDGTDYYNTIDWDNPGKDLPAFLTDKKDEKKD